MKITFNSPFILCFALACSLILLLNTLTHGLINNALACYYTSLTDPMLYVRLFTYPLVHADINHLVSNMTLFLVLGPILESKYGSKQLMICFALTSVVAGLVHLLVEGNTGLVGCSGIVFMMIILASFAGSRKGIPLTFILVAVLYLSQQAISAFTNNNVSELTHILGGVSGAFIGFKHR